MTGRRSFLWKAATAGVGTIGGLLLLPSPPDVPGDGALEQGVPDAAADAGGPDLPWDGPIADEDTSPVARYQYAPASGDGGSYRPTSPINVVVPLGDTSLGLEDVLAVLEDVGWIRRPEEYARYAWDRRREAFVLQEATAAETYYGTSGRCHVRCWAFEDVVSMQAHADTGARPKHGIESYDRARSRVERAFAGAEWTVFPAALDLTNEKPPDYDGFASVVEPGDRRG